MLIGAKQAAELYLEGLVIDSGADDVTDDMWRREAIHRYNAGTGSDRHYWVWTPPDGDEPGRWDPMPSGGAPGYVASVLAESAGCL